MRAASLSALLLAYSCAQGARANGRLPGATELAINRSDPSHLIARATFGMVQSFDGGASWQWICERAINVSGEADPPVATTEDGTIVLLPPARGTLVSRDRGCSWTPAPAPLSEMRAVDLTTDPDDPARVLVLLSKVDSIDDMGVVTYANTLMETRDNARTWTELSALSANMFPETLEIAPSDPSRIYVAGTSSLDPARGVLLRSEDGGASWSEHDVELPPGSGSLFISAVDPNDPDRLWVRLPARGDRFGILPVTLIMSDDKGESWATLAATEQQAMLGFALSPDGSRLAYGGPADGLYVGAADGSEGFTKRSDLRVRCLRWNADGLYACGTESLNAQQAGDPFSVGLSKDEGASFAPIYTIGDTCPQACPDASAFALTCMDVWSALSPLLGTSGEGCEVPWSQASEDDAGSATGDAGDAQSDASTHDAGMRDGGASATARSGCACSAVSRTGRTPMGFLLLLACAGLRRRLLIYALATLALFGCADAEAPGASDDADAAAYVACPDSIPELEPGVTFEGRDGNVRVELIDAARLPARKYRNDWTLALLDGEGEPLEDFSITRLEAFMPVHGHFSRPPAEVEPLDQPGRVDATIHFTMRGPWEVQLDVRSESAGEDHVVLDVCVKE